MKRPKLYIVSTPIGNPDDISLRALKVLKEVDIILCEEYKPARRLLSQYEIVPKELIAINEHNEKESVQDVLNMLLEGKTAALISDCGTPLFSDPGNHLIPKLIDFQVEITALPGANSLLPALVGSGFNTTNFYYYGWLSPKKDIRKRELFELKKRKDLLVIMETPYRLITLLKDVKKYFGDFKQICLAYKLTMTEEKYYRGTVKDVLRDVEKESLKGEFVLLIENR